MITKYEIVATKNDSRYVVAYTARKTKRSLINNTQTYADMIIAAVGADTNAVCVKADVNEIVMSDGTRVYYTGRTELDVERAA